MGDSAIGKVSIRHLANSFRDLSRPRLLCLGSRKPRTPLTCRGQSEYAAGQFYNLLDFGLRERIETRHAVIFLRKNYTRGDDADHRVVQSSGVTRARHSDFLGGVDRGGGDLVERADIGLDQPSSRSLSACPSNDNSLCNSGRLAVNMANARNISRSASAAP